MPGQPTKPGNYGDWAIIEKRPGHRNEDDYCPPPGTPIKSRESDRHDEICAGDAIEYYRFDLKSDGCALCKGKIGPIEKTIPLWNGTMKSLRIHKCKSCGAFHIWNGSIRERFMYIYKAVCCNGARYAYSERDVAERLKSEECLRMLRNAGIKYSEPIAVLSAVDDMIHEANRLFNSSEPYSNDGKLFEAVAAACGLQVVKPRLLQLRFMGALLNSDSLYSESTWASRKLAYQTLVKLLCEVKYGKCPEHARFMEVID